MAECTCGCATVSALTKAEPCSCGCDCCSSELSRDEELAELKRLQEIVAQRIETLEAVPA